MLSWLRRPRSSRRSSSRSRSPLAASKPLLVPACFRFHCCCMVLHDARVMDGCPVIPRPIIYYGDDMLSSTLSLLQSHATSVFHVSFSRTTKYWSWRPTRNAFGVTRSEHQQVLEGIYTSSSSECISRSVRFAIVHSTHCGGKDHWTISTAFHGFFLDGLVSSA